MTKLPAITEADVIAARRYLARTSLPDFACMVDIPTVPLTDEADEDRFGVMRIGSLAEHHKLLLERLQDLAEGRIPNLMVFMPPGSAKSTYVDLVFAAWYMATHRRHNVGLASYASDIARKQGRRLRQLLNSSSFKNLFPDVSVSAESHAADEFALTNGSEFMAGGILSGLTGNRFHLGLLDDPLKGREAAESELIRDKTWDEYVDSFTSRLVPGGPQVMVLTRWHEEDPAGRILPPDWAGESGWFDGRDGRRWYVLCLPAYAESVTDPLGRKPGEILWPQWFTDAHFAPYRKNARTWASLYQQRPAPDEGTYFQRVWFKRWTALPADLHYYMTSDHARSEGDGDYTVIRVWGYSATGDLFLAGGWRGQTTADRWIAEGVIPLLRSRRVLCWFPENDATWGAVAPFVTRLLRESSLAVRIEPLSTRGDKPTKAQSFQGMAAQGRIWLPQTPEGDEILAEYLRFPAGKHDDEVDAAAHMGRALDQAHPAIVKRVLSSNDPNDRWSRLRRDGGESWKVA